MKYLADETPTKPCGCCKKTYKREYFGLTKRGTVRSLCPKCRTDRNLDTYMQEPTSVLTYAQLLVRGNIYVGKRSLS